MKEKMTQAQQNKKTHRRRVWTWLVLVILVLAGATAWVLYDAGMLNLRHSVNNVELVATQPAAPVQPAQPESDEPTSDEIRPACAVIEDILLEAIVDDNVADWGRQEYSANVYSILAQRGCAENAKFFTDMAMRKQTIADGLRAIQAPDDNIMKSVEYLYSDEKVCQTIEKRVLQNINTNAHEYWEFLDNANTYSVLFEYGCCDNKVAYARAALRELGLAVALMPTDKMDNDQIMTVVEICKRLGVADSAHLMVQRLKARGYDYNFLMQIEDIIHGIR